MTFEKSRQQSRRQVERRTTERRALNHQFMTQDWLEQIQNKNLSWPKQDRRHNNRRLSMRRNIHRRKLSSLISSKSKTMTTGERKMLLDIINQSISD